MQTLKKEAKPQLMLLTPTAAEQVKVLLHKRQKPALGIRIGVKSGGCNGHKYYIEYADSRNQFDEIIQAYDVTILIDAKALMYLIGTTMDYVSDKFQSGFVFHNPNQKSSCGCGKSFGV